MEETLDQAVQRIFGARSDKALAQAVAPAAETGARETPADRALQHYQRAQDFLRQGNWGGFGDELKKLEGALKELQKNP
jgi:uncharacterized membrane protein (UPF0182 family)